MPSEDHPLVRASDRVSGIRGVVTVYAESRHGRQERSS
jgi:hypothetical protein